MTQAKVSVSLNQMREAIIRSFYCLKFQSILRLVWTGLYIPDDNLKLNGSVEEGINNNLKKF